MDSSVKAMFDAVASEYDRQRRQLIPCFDDFYSMAVSLVETSDPSPRILDLGAGTGLLSGLVLQKYPNAHMTLMDISEKMLEEARQRLSEAPHVRYIVGDYVGYTFNESYDFIISSLSIHHLEHTVKQTLFRTVYDLLEPGGVFVNADQVLGNTEQTNTYYRRRWLEAIHASGLSEEAIRASIERRKLDKNAKASVQIRWLEEAGFAESDCMYKYLDFAVFYAQKGK